MKSKLPMSRAKTAYGLLSEVCALIIAEPLRYHQGDWIRRIADDSTDDLPQEEFPSCGTVGCVAGWVATLKSPRGFAYQQTEIIAREALGLDSEQSFELFGGGMVSGNGQTLRHARNGVKHIRRFQKKYRAQLSAKKVR